MTNGKQGEAMPAIGTKRAREIARRHQNVAQRYMIRRRKFPDIKNQPQDIFIDAYLIDDYQRASKPNCSGFSRRLFSTRGKVAQLASLSHLHSWLTRNKTDLTGYI